MKDVLAIAFMPAIVKRSLKVASIVGTVLMVINHGDAIVAGTLNTERVIKIVMTYCVPYLVSTYSAVSATLECNRRMDE